MFKFVQETARPQQTLLKTQWLAPRVSSALLSPEVSAEPESIAHVHRQSETVQFIAKIRLSYTEILCQGLELWNGMESGPSAENS